MGRPYPVTFLEAGSKKAPGPHDTRPRILLQGGWQKQLQGKVPGAAGNVIVGCLGQLGGWQAWGGAVFTSGWGAWRGSWDNNVSGDLDLGAMGWMLRQQGGCIVGVSEGGY